METDPVAPFVVLPSGHIVQFASPAPANVFSEQFVHTPPIITTPAPVHTVNQKYNILIIYSFTQVNYIFYFISIHFYSPSNCFFSQFNFSGIPIKIFHTHLLTTVINGN